VVVDHDFNIAEDLAVSAVGFLARLGKTVYGLSVEGSVRLGVQHKWHGQQPLDPF
jgi:hypothetical protein